MFLRVCKFLFQLPNSTCVWLLGTMAVRLKRKKNSVKNMGFLSQSLILNSSVFIQSVAIVTQSVNLICWALMHSLLPHEPAEVFRINNILVPHSLTERLLRLFISTVYFFSPKEAILPFGMVHFYNVRIVLRKV